MDDRQGDLNNKVSDRPKSIKSAFGIQIIKIYRLLPLRLRQRMHESRLARIPRLLTRRLIVELEPMAYTIKSGPMKGKIIHTDLKNWSGYYLGTYEPEVIAALENHVKEGMVVLDIGANHGYFTILCSQLVGPRGIVYAFEPEPANYQLLAKTLLANDFKNVQAVKLAVSSRSGIEKLFTEEAYLGTHSLEKKGAGDFIEVDLTSVDDFMKLNQVERVDFVKIDVEGHEVEVLKGMTEAMQRWKPSIICEFQDQQLLSIGSEILESNGYLVTTIREHYETQIFAYSEKHRMLDRG